MRLTAAVFIITIVVLQKNLAETGSRMKKKRVVCEFGRVRDNSIKFVSVCFLLFFGTISKNHNCYQQKKSYCLILNLKINKNCPIIKLLLPQNL